MIKQLLVLFMVCLLSFPTVGASTFEFRYHGEPVPDNATVTIAAQEDDWGFGEMWCYTNPSDNPSNGLILKMLSSSQGNGTATMTINENTLNPTNITWCMGGSCMPFGNKTTITKDFSVNGDMLLVQFEAENIQNEGHLIATLTATIGNETHTVKIKFTHGAQVITGDVNCDSSVNASDVTALYNYILNGNTTFIETSDVNSDGSVNASDVTAVYNIILGN